MDFILDGGPAPLGLESTVIGFDKDKPVLLRPGAITREDIEAVVGQAGAAGDTIRSPGQLESHYAPRAALRLNVRHPEPGEALLGFGPSPEATLNLSAGRRSSAKPPPISSPCCASLDKSAHRIAVMPIPETGLGEAINDRLRRAAAPRS